MSDSSPPAAEAPTGPPPATWLQILPYFLASLTFGLTQGLGNNLFAGNVQALQAAFGATTNEAAWLTAAYASTSITAALLLYKLRAQFGLRLFAKLGLVLFLVVSAAHLVVTDLRSAVALRLVAGFAGAPLNTLAILAMIERLPPARKLTTGVALGLIGAQIAVPLARIISPGLLELGLWSQLNLLELSLALLSLAWVYALPITPPPRIRAFDRVDAVSLPLLVIGLGLVAVVLSLGRWYWWLEAPWLGVCLAAGLAALTLLIVIELNRERPIINLHWLSSKDMILFGGSMFFARFVLSEQTTGAIGFFQNLGLLNEHMAGLMWVILGATLAGFLGVACVNQPQNRPAIHAVALALIALGAWMESHGTSLTRPQDVYWPQALVAFGGAIFLPAATGWSFAHTLRSGMQYMTSFFSVFVASQNLGGLLGAAALGTLVTMREKFHSSQIVENLTLSDPMVAQRLHQHGAALARVLADPALRGAEGSVLLGQAATREAYVLAYNDLFLVVSLVATLCLLGLLLHQFAAWLDRRATPAPGAAA